MPDRRTRNLIRILVGTGLGTALFACIAVPIPEDLPAVAFRQAALYRLEVALLVFYGGLLLITPAFSGLLRGRLPTEISARGAKFADETDRSADYTDGVLEKLEQEISETADGLIEAKIEINRLKEQGVTKHDVK